MYRYIDNVFVLHHSNEGEYVDCIYPTEPDINDTISFMS
jgi:hypothetical protein